MNEVQCVVANRGSAASEQMCMTNCRLGDRKDDVVSAAKTLLR